MTTWLWRIVLSASVVMVVAGGTAIGADPRDQDLHIRSKEPDLRWLLDRGQARSETFRGLVNRLNASDIFVYLDYDFYARRGLGGKVSFISVAGGRRYLRVRIDCQLSLFDQIALIGHELQHAVEIADSAEVVDERTMARLYKRIGVASDVEGLENGVDSAAAIDAGRRVTLELLAAEAVRKAPARSTAEPLGDH